VNRVSGVCERGGAPGIDSAAGGVGMAYMKSNNNKMVTRRGGKNRIVPVFV